MTPHKVDSFVRAFIFMGRPPPEDGEDLYGYCRLTYKKKSKYKPTAAETAEANRKEDAKAAAKEAERKAKEDAKAVAKATKEAERKLEADAKAAAKATKAAEAAAKAAAKAETKEANRKIKADTMVEDKKAEATRRAEEGADFNARKKKRAKGTTGLVYSRAGTFDVRFKPKGSRGVYIGRFDTEEEAAHAYNTACLTQASSRDEARPNNGDASPTEKEVDVMRALIERKLNPLTAEDKKAEATRRAEEGADFNARKKKGTKGTTELWYNAGKFDVQFSYLGSRIYIGRFDTEEEVAHAYNTACLTRASSRDEARPNNGDASPTEKEVDVMRALIERKLASKGRGMK